MAKNYQYFVEGESEEKLINAFKIAPIEKLLAGKVEVFNFITKVISNQRIAVLKPNTTVILVYDIDVVKLDILNKNIKILKSHGIKDIIHIQSINNFEDEIVYSSNIKSINDVYGTVSKDEFKRLFLHDNSLITKLNSIGFDINKIWSRVNPNKPFSTYSKIEDLKSIKL